MKNVKKIFYTSIALTLTSFLMKTVAVWFNVYLTGLIGTAGMGLFQIILSLYALSKTLAYGGMNLAGTRLCIDDFEHRRFFMNRLLIIAGIIGTVACTLLISLADPISEYWVAESKSSSSLRILAFSLPFVSLSAALNGYMTASRRMSRYSVIQLIEQITKIALTVFFVGKSDLLSHRTAIDLICLAITVSEVVSFSIALLLYLFDMAKERASAKKATSFMRKFTRLALPDAFGAYIRSGLNTLEHLLIPKGIKQYGASQNKAFSDYGIVQGMALPVVLYPSSILGVVSGLLVPEIAECKQKNNKIQVDYIINRVLQIAMIFSLLIMAFMLTFSKELSLSVYKSTNAEEFIRLLAPLIPIMYLDMTTDGMLKGLDLQLDIMKINVIDSVLCVVLVWFLVPKMAVEGYLVTIYAAEIINFVLSFTKLCKSSGLSFKFGKNFIGPIFSSIFAMMWAKKVFNMVQKTTPGLIMSAGVGLILYVILLRITRSISKEDARWFARLFQR